MTNVTGLFLACFVWSSFKLMFSGLLQKDLVKEVEVWRNVFRDNIVTLVKQGLPCRKASCTF